LNISATTEAGLRGTRQVFDYDNLPESRLKEKLGVSFEETFDEDEEMTNDNLSYEDSLEQLTSKLNAFDDKDYQDKSNKFIKRIDKLVDRVEDAGIEDEFEELLSEEDEDDDNDDDNDGEDEDHSDKDDDIDNLSDEFDARGTRRV